MVLVVLGFITLTAYAVISSYAPAVAGGGARGAGAFFALLVFCALVRRLRAAPCLAKQAIASGLSRCKSETALHGGSVLP
jgi:hypothetical protein